MPVTETDFLKAVVDPNDRLHKSSMKALQKVKKKLWHVASSALIEIDLLLKVSGISINDRFAVFQALRSEMPKDMILPISHQTILRAISLQRKYSQIKYFYFDSIHLAIAVELDGMIVSSDETFDQIKEVKRIPLEKL
jgi:predicted nucleic acid-binding protein